MGARAALSSSVAVTDVELRKRDIFELTEPALDDFTPLELAKTRYFELPEALKRLEMMRFAKFGASEQADGQLRGE